MKVCFVGAGAIAHAHREAIQRLGGTIAGVCTRGPSGEKFAQDYGVAKVFKCVETMISDCRPDAVFVLTHPDSYPAILTAIKSFDLPTFLEKPLALSVSAAEALTPMLPSVCFVGLNRRFYSNIVAIREQLTLEPAHLAILCVPERKRDYEHLNESDRNSWHQLNCIHCVDLIVQLSGRPERYLAQNTWGVLSNSVLPRYTLGVAVTNRGATIIVASNFDSPGGWRLQFMLASKEIVISPLERTVIRSLAGEDEVAKSNEDDSSKPGFIAQTKCFFEGIQTGSTEHPEWVSFNSALESMQVADELFCPKV